LSSRILQGETLEAHRSVFLLIFEALILPLALRPLLRRLEPIIDAAAGRRAEFLDSTPGQTPARGSGSLFKLSHRQTAAFPPKAVAPM
jgi:hypothetical protein